MWGPRDAPIRPEKRIQLRHRGHVDIFLQLGISPRGGARADVSRRRAEDVERSFTEMCWYVHVYACSRGKVGTINIAFYQTMHFRWIETMVVGIPALVTVYVSHMCLFRWNTQASSSGAAVEILQWKHICTTDSRKDGNKGNTVYRCARAFPLFIWQTPQIYGYETRKSVPGRHCREI